MDHRVLVVDDDEKTRRSVGAVLAANGYRVEFAVDGKEAMQQIRERQYDVIISDQLMPNITGQQLAIVVNRTLPGTPLIMLTGDPVAQEFPLTEGVTALLEKPVTSDTLLSAVAHALRKK
jgi:CheY-like chemotaxis protein